MHALIVPAFTRQAAHLCKLASEATSAAATVCDAAPHKTYCHVSVDHIHLCVALNSREELVELFGWLAERGVRRCPDDKFYRSTSGVVLASFQWAAAPDDALGIMVHMSGAQDFTLPEAS